MTDEENINRIFNKPPIVRVYPNNNNNQNQSNDEEIIEENTQEEHTENEILDENNQNIQNTIENIQIEEEIIEPIHEPSLEIVGTAHISEKSVNTVRETIYNKRPEIVAIELDIGRYQRLLDESNGIKREEKLDMKSLLKSSNLIVTLVSTFLAHTQKKMGADVGVQPGSEMLEAAKIAQEVNADIALIDRNIQTTLKRTINGMSFKEKIKFIWELLVSYVSGDDDEDTSFEEEIERLKQEDTIMEVMNYFKEASPGGYNALVHERDAYMAYNLKSLEDSNVVAVVGAGHKTGILKFLENPESIPSIEELSYVKESRFSLIQIFLYSIPVIFVIIFIVAFFQGINIEGGLINYLIFAGGGAFIGSLLSGSKIQSAIVAMLVAPITVLHPLLAAGWFSGLVEAKLRNVGFDDLHSLADFESFRDLWHNKLFRVLIVVIGTNLGCTIGVLITINKVFLPYLHTIFGL
ncbi:MAG: TraB/GumN family protein [Methanosphaera sp.]|nr:TraB/GumN family protein [Methanosphaera sp.]